MTLHLRSGCIPSLLQSTCHWTLRWINAFRKFIILHNNPQSFPNNNIQRYAADSKLGQVQRLLSGFYCSTLFLPLFYVSSFIQTICKCQSELLVHKDARAAPPPPGAQQAEISHASRTVRLAGKEELCQESQEMSAFAESNRDSCQNTRQYACEILSLVIHLYHFILNITYDKFNDPGLIMFSQHLKVTLTDSSNFLKHWYTCPPVFLSCQANCHANC